MAVPDMCGIGISAVKSQVRTQMNVPSNMHSNSATGWFGCQVCGAQRTRWAQQNGLRWRFDRQLQRNTLPNFHAPSVEAAGRRPCRN